MQSSICVYFKRGEFLLLITGTLQDQSGKNSTKLADHLFLDLSSSNIKQINNKLIGNSIPVKIFSCLEEKLICRLALFANRGIKTGEELSFDFSSLSLFSQVNI